MTEGKKFIVPEIEVLQESANENQKLKWWQILWGMLCRPERTYRITKGRSGLLLPVLISFGGTTLTTLVVSISQQEEIAALMYKELAGAGMSPADIEGAISLAASPWALAFGAAGAVVTILFTWVIHSGSLHLAVRALGGKGSFRQAFEIVGWAWVALFIGGLVKSGYIMVTGNLRLPQGNGLGYAFMTHTDVFVIWNMVLLVLGFAAIYEVHKWKTAVPVVMFWLITVLLTYAISLMPQVLGS